MEETITTHFNGGMVFLLQQNPKYGSSRRAPAGIEPDNDRVPPVGRQRELNPFNSALPAPSPPHQADRFANVQVGGLHAGRNRFVFNRHCWSGPRFATGPDFWKGFRHAVYKITLAFVRIVCFYSRSS